LRVDPGVTIGRHTHAGGVHAYSVSGSRQLDTGANDVPLDYIDTPKLRELYLAWCGENGFESIDIGAAA
jgi:hypothetical protein